MDTINLSEAKDKLSRLVKETAETTKPVVISVQGRKEVVLISMEEYHSLMETIEILKDHNLVKKILASTAEMKRGETTAFDDIKEEI